MQRNVRVKQVLLYSKDELGFGSSLRIEDFQALGHILKLAY